MQKLLHLPTALCVVVSTACYEAAVEETVVESAGSYAETQPAPPEAFFDEVVVVAEPAQKVSPELRKGWTPLLITGVQLARMTVSEATSLQPLNETWPLDMQGILQVARNTRGTDTLLASLKELSPHVGKVEAYTDGRQPWTSTLPVLGIGAPELWEECVGWETVRGRKRGIPEGCHGVWEAGADNWAVVRSYAIELVAQDQMPSAVQGNPIAWGGVMDLARFLKNRPNLCWLESGSTVNYFFGLKSDPANTCKPISHELVQESKLVSAKIVARSIRRKAEEN